LSQAGAVLSDNQLDLTPLQKQVLVQGFHEIKQQEIDAQSKMMGGKGTPTSQSTRNGKSKTGSRTEENSYVNPNAVNPIKEANES
jgi:hypothetical protein